MLYFFLKFKEISVLQVLLPPNTRLRVMGRVDLGYTTIHLRFVIGLVAVELSWLS